MLVSIMLEPMILAFNRIIIYQNLTTLIYIPLQMCPARKTTHKSPLVWYGQMLCMDSNNIPLRKQMVEMSKNTFGSYITRPHKRRYINQCGERQNLATRRALYLCSHTSPPSRGTTLEYCVSQTTESSLVISCRLSRPKQVSQSLQM